MSMRPPLPPFARETAIQKVRLAEDGWNSRNPSQVALAYSVDSRWRNRSEFLTGREEIIAFLTRKWTKELEYRLIKELWAFAGNRIDRSGRISNQRHVGFRHAPQSPGRGKCAALDRTPGHAIEFFGQHGKLL